MPRGVEVQVLSTAPNECLQVVSVEKRVGLGNDILCHRAHVTSIGYDYQLWPYLSATIGRGDAAVVAKVLIVFILGSSLFADILVADPAPELLHRSVRMLPGQVRSVSFPQESSLHVSRRGIIDVAHVGQGRWHLTALRSGIVMITADTVQSAGGGDAARLLVEVIAADSVEAGKAAVPESNLIMPPWLCKEPGIRCQSDAGIISGETKSVDWFRRAQTFCRLRSDCRLSVTLDVDTLANWERETAAILGPRYAVSTLGKNLLSVMSYCGDTSSRHSAETEVDAVTQGGLSEGVIIFRCLEDRNDHPYQLQIRMFSIQEAEARVLGLDTKINADAAVPHGISEIELLSKFESMAKDRRVETIAEPVVRIVGNQPIELSTGSEHQVLTSKPPESKATRASSPTLWKQLGLKVKVGLTELSRERVRIRYDLSYRDRSGRELDVNMSEIQSEVICKLGTPTIASILDLRGKGGDKAYVPIFAQIPLIGPLFNRNSYESLKTRMVLWFVVRPEDHQDNLAPIAF